MTYIDPLDLDDPAVVKLGSRLEKFAVLGDDSATFLRILAHAPQYAEALWDAMDEALFRDGMDHSLKEMVRIQLATKAGDPYFSKLRSKMAIDAGLTEERIQAALGDFDKDPQFSPAEKWALEYAFRMYRTPETVDAAFYDEGKKLWTEAQIMELGGLVAIHYGMQVFMATLQPR
ncbi:MAG: alkylhydroperoxidase family enzyme [Verrucomicrobiales bacterium]|jgi:alkylhydroperoxidase family enzyme